MWIFTELADLWDEIRREDDRFLDEVFQGWVDYAVRHADDPVWYSSLRNVAIYTGVGVLDASWKLSTTVATGFVDVLRIGDGVKKGGWGYGQDALRLLVVAGPTFRLARYGLSTLASIDAFPTSGICAWVSAAKALRLTGVRHFATVADLAKAVGVTGDSFPLVYGLSTVLKYLQQLGAIGRSIVPFSRNIETSLLAATEANPNGVVMFGVQWMRGGDLVGHALIATRNMLTGQLQILDRSGRVVSTLAELESLVPGYGPISTAQFAAKDAMIVIDNATSATAIDRLSKAALGGLVAEKALDVNVPEEKEVKDRLKVHAAFDASPLLQYIGLEVRQVPFRAEKGRKIRVSAKPIVPESETETVSSTVCTELYDSELYDGVAIAKKSKRCVTTVYEYQLYSVVSGDSLAKIAKRFYGTEKLWPMVHEANKAMLGKDPHRIGALRPGMKLHIVMSAKKADVTTPSQ